MSSKTVSYLQFRRYETIFDNSESHKKYSEAEANNIIVTTMPYIIGHAANEKTESWEDNKHRCLQYSSHQTWALNRKWAIILAILFLVSVRRLIGLVEASKLFALRMHNSLIMVAPQQYGPGRMFGPTMIYNVYQFRMRV